MEIVKYCDLVLFNINFFRYEKIFLNRAHKIFLVFDIQFKIVRENRPVIDQYHVTKRHLSL